MFPYLLCPSYVDHKIGIYSVCHDTNANHYEISKLASLGVEYDVVSISIKFLVAYIFAAARATSFEAPRKAAPPDNARV
jgi:hypothetical protein